MGVTRKGKSKAATARHQRAREQRELAAAAGPAEEGTIAHQNKHIAREDPGSVMSHHATPPASATSTAAGTSSPAACRRRSALATITATPARMTTQMPLMHTTPYKSSQLTARSATLRIGITSSVLGARPSLRQPCYITLGNVRAPLAGGPCAGHPTQSHLLAARSILTLAEHTS